MSIYETIKEIYNFVFRLRLRIKLMPEKEFAALIANLDYHQTVYAVYFRYF